MTGAFFLLVKLTSKADDSNRAKAAWNAKNLFLLNWICLTCWLGPHCLAFREICANESVAPVAQPEAHRELCFWAHGGDVAEKVGIVSVRFKVGFGIALVQFIRNNKTCSPHKSVRLPLCCYTEGVCCHIFHNKVKRFCSKLRKHGQYLRNFKRVHNSLISFLIQPFQWRTNPQTMVNLHIVFSW